MAGGFRSIGVSLGLDVTGLQRGFNQATSALDKFLAQFRQRLQASGLRGFSRLLGPGAVIYGIYEGYKLATTAADNFLKSQEKIQAKLAETAKQDAGTARFAQDIQNLEKFNYKIDATTAKVLAAQSGINAFKDFAVGAMSAALAKVYSFYKGVYDGTTAFKAMLEGASFTEAGKIVDENSAKNQANDTKTDQRLRGLFGDGEDGYGGQIAEINKAAQEKLDAENKRIEDAKRRLYEAYDAAQEKQKSPQAELSDNLKRANELAIKTYSAQNYEDSPQGRDQRIADYQELTRLTERQAELTKEISESQAKINEELERNKDLQEQLDVSHAKAVSLEKEQAQVEKELADTIAAKTGLTITDNLANNHEHQKEINDLLTQQIELQNKDNEIIQRKGELLEQAKNILQELNNLDATRNQKNLEALAPSEAELLKKGGPGTTTQRAAAEEARRHEELARSAYNDYATNEAIANDPKKSAEERQSARQRAEAAKKRMQREQQAQQQAEERSGSKEGLQLQQQQAEDDKTRAHLQQKANDIHNQVSGPVAPPLTNAEFSKQMQDLLKAITAMSAKLDPKPPTATQ